MIILPLLLTVSAMAAETFKLTPEDFRIFTDFKPGIRFVDIMPLLKDAYKFRQTIMTMAEGIRKRYPDGVDYIAALELRGVPFAAPLAYELGCGLVNIRKPNKLPGPVFSTPSSHSYGSTDLTIQQDAVEEGAKVVVVDDLLALGGTLTAAVKLLQQLKANILECLVVIELPGAPGRANLEKAFPDISVNSVMTFVLPEKEQITK